ncbi:MAG: hypothetical protein IE909_01930 [Campylobacterales bacterium]|nr:hypothetical protein [Campylobacterales bacterium]
MCKQNIKLAFEEINSNAIGVDEVNFKKFKKDFTKNTKLFIGYLISNNK